MTNDEQDHIIKSLREGQIRMLKQSDIMKCPHVIMLPSHYREDGTCKCDDPEERKMMIAEWDYTEDDFKGIPLRKEK